MWLTQRQESFHGRAEIWGDPDPSVTCPMLDFSVETQSFLVSCKQQCEQATFLLLVRKVQNQKERACWFPLVPAVPYFDMILLKVYRFMEHDVRDINDYRGRGRRESYCLCHVALFTLHWIQATGLVREFFCHGTLQRGDTERTRKDWLKEINSWLVAL